MTAPLSNLGHATDRLKSCLDEIAHPSGQGMRACLTTYESSAFAEADAADARRRNGISLGPLDGVIVSIKDLFDVRGEVTRGGCAVLLNEKLVAAEDADAVRRLRAGGAIIIAKTNMSELAFSGVGTNPHFGTPGNPLDRSRVPGGSSSGAAVAVADGFCEISIGTDTGGSVRIPAALCGLTGFKPTQGRVSREGVFPLSRTLDCVGPIGRSVADCVSVDQVLSGDSRPVAALPLEGLRLGVVLGLPFKDITLEIVAVFQAAAEILSNQGTRITSVEVREIEDMRELNARTGGIVAAEAFALHAGRMASGDQMDPHVAARIDKGRNVSAATYIELLSERRRLMLGLDDLWDCFDLLAMPTVPIPAPTIAEVAAPDRFNDRNLLLLRNTSIANFFDCPAISLPIQHGGAIAGFTLMARPRADRRLLAIASGVEAAFDRSGVRFHHGEIR